MKYESGTKRLFGIAVPLSALNTENSWRLGEYPDLAAFAGLAKKLGAGIIQLLPLNDTGSQSSPYSALSAFALHPLYIRASDLPEAAACPKAVAELSAFAAKAKKGERFPYEAALKNKLEALREIYDTSEKGILHDAELKRFIQKKPWIKSYAVYKQLKAANSEKSWKDWPLYRNPSMSDLAALWQDSSRHKELMFYAWLQYRAAEQFSLVAEAVHKMGIELLGDLPILMNEDSADVWADRQNFDTSMKAGAPPDMYSDAGQNWGFPLYNWAAMKESGHSFWKARIAEAANYYSAYRIDHVLGFFRIWALEEKEESGRLGRYIPGLLIKKEELLKLGFSDERITWLSEPHIYGFELREKLAHPEHIEELALKRMENEDLYLFNAEIRGEADISALALQADAKDFLKNCWHNRAFLKVKENDDASFYTPVWTMEQSRSWNSLSAEEKGSIRQLLDSKLQPVEKTWEEQGTELLSMLKEASDMLPCAEDLGAVPDCVPVVLEKLGIPGLRIPRWMRHWKKAGQPFVDLAEYDELSVCTPSVHDTSTLRAWWDKEEGKEEFVKILAADFASIPQKLDTETQEIVLKALAGCKSRLFVVQLQDILDLDDIYRTVNPEADRINVPGTLNDFNWTWKMPIGINSLFMDEAWCKLVSGIAARE